MKIYSNALFLLFCGLFFQPVFAKESSFNSMDKIVATINDSVITKSELQQETIKVKKQIAANGMATPPESTLHKQVLEQLVNRRLQLELASRQNITINEKETDAAISDIAKRNNVPIEGVYQQMASQGISKTEYRKELSEELLLQKIQQTEVGSKITITPQEVDDFLRSNTWRASNSREYHLEDILIATPDEPTSTQLTEAKKRAENVLAHIHQNGTRFNEVAMKESTTNALKGGDLGWRKFPEIPTVFADHIINAKVDDVIGPIQAPNGFHLIHLAGIRNTGGAKQVATNQRSQVQQFIFQRKMEEGLQNWITKLRTGAYIDITAEA